MKKEELLKSIGQIDEKFILEADEVSESADVKDIKTADSNRRRRRFRYASAVAAFAVVVGAGIMALGGMKSLNVPNRSEMSSGSNAPIASETQSESSANKSDNAGTEIPTKDSMVTADLKDGFIVDYSESMSGLKYVLDLKEGNEVLVIVENESGSAEISISASNEAVVFKDEVIGQVKKESSLGVETSDLYVLKIDPKNAKGFLKLNIK